MPTCLKLTVAKKAFVCHKVSSQQQSVRTGRLFHSLFLKTNNRKLFSTTVYETRNISFYKPEHKKSFQFYVLLYVTSYYLMLRVTSFSFSCFNIASTVLCHLTKIGHPTKTGLETSTVNFGWEMKNCTTFHIKETICLGQISSWQTEKRNFCSIKNF